MKVNDVISTLKSRGIELWQEGNALRYRARAGTLTEQERATLRAHKPAILQALADSLSNPTTTTSQAPVAGSAAVVVPPARECQGCVHFEPYPYEPLGSCHIHERMQHATSKPRQFGCGHFQPTSGRQEVRS